MQIRECEVVPNWVKQLVHEVKVVKIAVCVLTIQNFFILHLVIEQTLLSRATYSKYI